MAIEYPLDLLVREVIQNNEEVPMEKTQLVNKRGRKSKPQIVTTKLPSIIEHTERKKFLVVEDDFAAQPIWEKIIRTIEPRAIILWATTGEGAELLIEEAIKGNDAFDIVVSDVFLAGEKTGVGLWKKFHKESVDFLLTSGMDWKDFVHMMDDVDDIKPCLLQKPFRVADGVNTLATLMSYDRYFSRSR